MLHAEAGMSSTNLPLPRRTTKMEITRKEFESYNEVRESGVTNMFMVSTVSDLSGLDKEQIFFIMKNYTELKEKFGGKN